MTDVSEFPSTTSQDFGFKSIGNSIKLVSDFQEQIPYKHFNNFSYAPHTGLIAAAGKNDIVLGTLKGLVHDVTSQAQEYSTDSHTLEIGNVNNTVFTSDEKNIVVSVGNSVLFANVHEQNYKQLQPQDFQSVEFTNQIDLVIPSPSNGEILAILDTTGDLFLAELSSNTIKRGEPLAQNVLSFSWSPKGKQIVITKADGTIQQIDLKGTIKATIDGSQYISEENLLPLSISWLSTFKFFVVFGEEQHPLEDGDDIASYDFKTLIITHNKGSKDDYSENFDAIPSFGTLMRKPTLYTSTFHGLSSSLPALSLFASSTSTDVSAITDHELLLPADDSQRASLPLNEETDNDVNSIGMIIDARIAEPVIEPCPGISSADWLPTVWVLGNDGKVQGWYIFHVGDLREKSFNSEGAIKYQDVLFQEAQGANSITLEPKITKDPQNDPEISLSFGNFSLESKDNSAAEHKIGSTTKQAFASTPSSSGSTQSPFGNEQKPSFGSTSKPVFGSATNGKPSLFGEQKAPAFGSSSFGSTTDQKIPAFGSSDFGSTTKPAFGSSGFGSSSFGSTSKPVFGSTTTEKPSLFGEQKISAFGSSGFGSTTSGKAPAFGSSGFGSTTSEKAPAFGSSGFGSTTSEKAPAFGSSSFGSTTSEKGPAFGSSSFSSTSKPLFGSTSTEKPSLFGDQKTSAFGSSGFGSTTSEKAPAFGSSGFGSTTSEKTPAFGSSSFGSTTKPAFGSSTLNFTKNDASSGSSSEQSPFTNLSKPNTSSNQPQLPAFGSTSFGSTNEQQSSINSNKTASETKSKPIFGSEQTSSGKEDTGAQIPENQALNESKISVTKNPANTAFSFGPSSSTTNVGSTTFSGGHQFGSTSFGNKPVADTTKTPFSFTTSGSSGLGSSGFASFADESPFQKLKKGTSIFGGQDSVESPFATLAKKDENKAESPFKAWEKTAETDSSLSKPAKPVLTEKSPFGGLFGKNFDGTQRKSNSPLSDSGTDSDDELADELRLDENEDKELEALEDGDTEEVISSGAPSAYAEDNNLEGLKSDAKAKTPLVEFAQDTVKEELGSELVKDKAEEEQLDDAEKTTKIETNQKLSSSSEISLEPEQELDQELDDDKTEDDKLNELERKTKVEEIKRNQPSESQFGTPFKINAEASTSTDRAKQELDEELAKERAENIDIERAAQKVAEEEKIFDVSEVATELGSSDSIQGQASGDDDDRVSFVSETEDVDDDVEVIDEESVKGFNESISSTNGFGSQGIPLSNSTDTKNSALPLPKTSSTKVAAPYITESVQTADIINDSVVVQSFENDEDYFNSFFIPPEVPSYVYLTKVSYPRLSSDAGFQEVEKIYYDTQAEIDIVEENCRNLGIFLNEHLKSEPVHTAKFLNSPKHWRLNEAKSISGIIDEQLARISELGLKIKSDSDKVEAIKNDLKKLDKQQVYITEKLMFIGKDIESKARQLPYDTVVLQDRLRRSSLEVSNRLRDAEESIILLKVSIDKRNASSTAIEDLIDHLNSVLVLTSDEVKKISKLKAEQEKFFEELNTAKDFESSTSKIKLDDSAIRLKNRRKLANILRKRSATSITDQ